MIVKALVHGIGQVLRAPLLVAAAVVVTLAAAVPFGLVLGSELRAGLAHQPPIDTGASEIDADWWNEFESHAGGLAATFTPTVIGFAAPLDNLSAMLDGTRRPLVIVLPAAVGIVTWAWLWAIALRRFARGRATSVADAVGGAFSALPRFLAISGVALILQGAAYFTIHPLLFDVIYPAVIGDATSEPAAFAIRVGFYVIFGIPLALVALFADYSRVAHVVAAPSTMGEMFRLAAGFIRRRLSSVATLYVMTGILFVAITAGYGIVDIFGGTRVGGWRGVAIGQAFIVGRVMVRLIFGASEIALFKAIGDQASSAER